MGKWIKERVHDSLVVSQLVRIDWNKTQFVVQTPKPPLFYEMLQAQEEEGS